MLAADLGAVKQNTCICSLLRTWYLSYQRMYISLEQVFEEVQAEAARLFYDLAFGVSECHFCCFLLVKQVIRPLTLKEMGTGFQLFTGGIAKQTSSLTYPPHTQVCLGKRLPNQRSEGHDPKVP